MKRTTISLPDDVAVALAREARRKRTSVSGVARAALVAHLGLDAERRELPFAALGASGESATARNLEDILEAEWRPE
jgi:predicted transcriptional regulator